MPVSPSKLNSHAPEDAAADDALAAEDTVFPDALRMLEGLSDACLVADVEGRVVFANDSARELLRLRGRAAGRRLAGVLADRHALEVVEECLTAGRPKSAVLSLTFSAEGTRSYLLSAMPVGPAGEGRLVRIALRPAEGAASGQDVVKEGSTGDALCRLGDPLTIIQGYLENLLDGVIRDPIAMRQCLAAMQRQTAHIQRILGGLRQ